MKSSLQINAESESQTLKIGNPQNESVTIKSALDEWRQLGAA